MPETNVDQVVKDAAEVESAAPAPVDAPPAPTADQPPVAAAPTATNPAAHSLLDEIEQYIRDSGADVQGGVSERLLRLRALL